MIRRFNYTDRKRIGTSNVQIELVPGPKVTKSFKARLALGEYGLPPDAKVFVEAYEKVAYMRFDFGTVSELREPPKDKLYLTEFEGSDSVRFRVKVVDTSTHEGQLVAEADAIIPRSPDEVEQNRLSLLPVKFAPLGEQAWRIEFSGTAQGMPILAVNDKLPDRNAFVRSPAFMALVHPAIVREILTHILAGDNEWEDDDSWQSKWIEFGRSFLFSGDSPPESEEDRPEWIEKVVTGFCDRYNLFANYANANTDGGSDGFAAQA